MTAAFKPAPPIKRFYRPDEVAAMLMVSRKTIYNWIASGKIPSARVGRLIRVPVKDLEALLQAPGN